MIEGGAELLQQVRSGGGGSGGRGQGGSVGGSHPRAGSRRGDRARGQ